MDTDSGVTADAAPNAKRKRRRLLVQPADARLIQASVRTGPPRAGDWIGASMKGRHVCPQIPPTPPLTGDR
jgi:hypothetical protein